MLPGFTAPAAALVAVYAGDLAIPGQVQIDYGTRCDAASSIVRLAIQAQPGRITRRVSGRVPAGVTLPPGGAQVRVQVYFDGDGVPHRPVYAGGPAALAEAAIEAASEFRADPPRVNGAPMLQASTITVAFKQ